MISTEYEEGNDGDFDQSLYFFEQLNKFCEDSKNAALVSKYPRSVPQMMTALKRKQELREKVDVNFDGRVSFLYVTHPLPISGPLWPSCSAQTMLFLCFSRQRCSFLTLVLSLLHFDVLYIDPKWLNSPLRPFSPLSLC